MGGRGEHAGLHSVMREKIRRSDADAAAWGDPFDCVMLVAVVMIAGLHLDLWSGVNMQSRDVTVERWAVTQEPPDRHRPLRFIPARSKALQSLLRMDLHGMPSLPWKHGLPGTKNPLGR